MQKEHLQSDNTVHETYHVGIGRVRVDSVPLSKGVKAFYSTYTYSGKVLISYRTENDSHLTDFYNIAILNDDGSDFRLIFSGFIPTKPKANGIRFMIFQDNTKVLLGDYVLECTPTIDTCTSSKLVPVSYPSILEEDERTTHHWSEIIIAPDNKHISWTMLRSDVGAAVAIGTLERKAERYVIENVQLISSIQYFKNDPIHAGYILPQTIRGGEVKQFIRGGTAISVVGGGRNSTPDSMVMDLLSEQITQITHTPGYDETTIFSPDERLGIVMSTRFSKSTDPAIFGILPKPYGAQTLMGMAWSLYMYAIAGVRRFRKGNIGPVLIDIQRSMNEPGYLGVQLTTEENWVYVSPMSWHPDGKRVMWMEMLRGIGQMRIQYAKLLDYEPYPFVHLKSTPDHIPYGVKDLSLLNSANPNVEGKIAGKHLGYIDYIKNVKGYSGKTEARYVNFSDDGINFYSGTEKVLFNATSECRYEAALELKGPIPGEMNLRATFSSLVGPKPARLLFETDIDGKPKSYGYAQYNGTRLNIEDLSE
ncbi:TolB-like translocation protein [Cohnella cholangitidis]|uniref:Uncharacterized protein n=1 Tax=Cohnella cholangitidis TaxID=2598458 RepID=A0A7G5C445_9BACL|nr:hypothetical protein [Cohnella cholangitidis]QMV43979.1 hypothetical protein FPL14_24495 [Cohnella cholangitidis]